MADHRSVHAVILEVGTERFQDVSVAESAEAGPPLSKGSLVVRGGIDPPTSGFSDPYRLFHYIPVGVNALQSMGFLISTDT